MKQRHLVHFLAGEKRAALYVGWSQAWWRDGGGANLAPNTKLSITRSFLELQSPDFTKWPPNTKLSITHPFFELQSPDFAWKFVWTVRTKYKSTKSTKKYKSTKVLITQSIFELQTPDFTRK